MRSIRSLPVLYATLLLVALGSLGLALALGSQRVPLAEVLERFGV